jgi:hypothetical protein
LLLVDLGGLGEEDHSSTEKGQRVLNRAGLDHPDRGQSLSAVVFTSGPQLSLESIPLLPVEAKEGGIHEDLGEPPLELAICSPLGFRNLDDKPGLLVLSQCLMCLLSRILSRFWESKLTTRVVV